MKRIILLLLILVLVSGCNNDKKIKCEEAVRIDYGYENPDCFATWTIFKFLFTSDCYCVDYECGIKSCRSEIGTRNFDLIEMEDD